MNINKSLIGFLLMVALGLPRCTEDEKAPDYPDLTAFLHRFEDEAINLGYEFNLSNVQVAYVDQINMGGKTFCGYGYSNYDGAGLRRIEISKSGACGWKDRSDIERENLFFHEIGHAFFLRTHDEAKQCDGTPLSLMSSTTNAWAFYGESENEKRTYYISELIDPMAALAKCIDYRKDWFSDSVFYSFPKDDEEWIFDSVGDNYSGLQGPEDAVLKIASNPQTNTTKNGYWFRQFSIPAVPECAKVKLKVRMNSSMLTGVGASISIRAYSAQVGQNGAHNEELVQLSTHGNPVAGQLVDHWEELEIPCYTRKVTTLIIFVVLMGESQGEVNFDKIQIVVKEE